MKDMGLGSKIRTIRTDGGGNDWTRNAEIETDCAGFVRGIKTWILARLVSSAGTTKQHWRTVLDESRYSSVLYTGIFVFS